MQFDSLLAAVDALIVAAPADMHHAVTPAALRAGKHVLVEKPIASTLAQADELGSLARASSLVLQVGHLERFSAAFQALEGRTGPPFISRLPASRRSSRGAPMSRSSWT